jgi:hypothetical protein
MRAPIAISRTVDRKGWEVWARWTAAMTWGEFAGFAIPAVVGALAAQHFPDEAGPGPRLAVAALLVAAGTLEGAVLGFAQALVLRHYVPGFSAGQWMLATAAGAALAWAIGMLPSTLGDPTALPPIVLWLGVAILGPMLLVSLGIAQWMVLRRHLAHAAHWIWISALAWLAGLAVVFGGMSLTQAGDPLWRLISIAAVSGWLMGATAAAVSGCGLAWLLNRASHPPTKPTKVGHGSV